MLSHIVKLPILKRLIPSLGIRIFKLLKINKKFYKIGNIHMYLDFLDPVDRQIIINKKYEEDAVNFLEKELNKNNFSSFLDIGANSGYFSFYFGSKFQNIKIKAFEPNVEAFEKFEITTKKNSFKNIKIFNFGLSDNEKKINMITWYKHGHAKTNSIILEKSHDLRNSKIFEANLKIGDEILNYHSEKLCIKIDVEGHELNVLKGLSRNLNNNKCLVLVEVADNKYKNVNSFFIQNNFKQVFKSKFRLDYIYSNL